MTTDLADFAAPTDPGPCRNHVIENSKEAERQCERRLIRNKLAKHDALMSKRAALLVRVKQLDEEIDAAADEHQLTCVPLQTKLEEIEQRIVDLLSARQPVPSELEAERNDLLRQVEDANSLLADTVASLKRRRSPLAKEAQKISIDAGSRQAIENELAREGTANPDLFEKLWVAKKLIQMLGGAVDASRKRGGTLRRDNVHRPDVFERRYDALTDKLATLLADATAEADSLRKQIVDE